MQEYNISEIPNSTNWRVVHDGENNLFYIKNDNGNGLPGVFTKRVFADRKLYVYLLDLNQHKVKTKNKLPD